MKRIRDIYAPRTSSATWTPSERNGYFYLRGNHGVLLLVVSKVYITSMIQYKNRIVLSYSWVKDPNPITTAVNTRKWPVSLPHSMYLRPYSKLGIITNGNKSESEVD